jgi:tetratricopeptide (TPR) repeat protein
MEALILYWKHFPITPDQEYSPRFVKLMEESVSRAERMKETPGTYLEGVFFDLFGRAFQAMFWADNGKPSKVAGDLRPMYRNTLKGFELMDDFNEFYFSTGLYNYYIEAYPEAHPIYKPLLSFAQDGDRELGLKQLDYAIGHTVFLRVEATLFMTIIQLNYENDLDAAVNYAESLYREFPANPFYRGLLISILLHQHRYTEADKVLSRIRNAEDDYSRMVYFLGTGFLAEKAEGDRNKATTAYESTLTLATSLGNISNMYRAMAHMGLARLSAQDNMRGTSRRHAKKAAKHTPYAFILNERQKDSW